MIGVKIVALVACAALLTAAPTRAFVVDSVVWTKNRTVTMNLSLGGPRLLSDGFNSFNESAADALNLWNGSLVHMQFAPVVASPLPPEDDDADNSVLFSPTIYGMAFGTNTIAVTLVSIRGNVRLESDVLFNSNRSWDSYRGPLGPALDFHRVALHEFGHVLGLEHPNESGQTVSAIMNSSVNDTDALQPDDMAGAHSLYDAGPPYLFSNPAPHLVNLSTRALVGTGDNVLIGGFIIQGSEPATVILRAIGHSLAARGIGNSLRDSLLELRNSTGSLITENDDWITGPDAERIASYRLDPASSQSAVFRALAPGSYTVIVRAFDNNDGNLTGTALVELYDLHTTGGRAGNISSRGQILTGDDVMIAGYIVGAGPGKEVVVRGLGPSLTSAGVVNALADPTLELYNATGTALGSNDNWQTDANSSRVQSVGLAPTQPVEAALDVTLNPGAYTAILRGRNGGTGVGLVEVYDISPPPN